ncbi:hypothetical protein NL676_001644 [Syzygium grande]|nr:hypothetical protein NL676_001644 [Syzygium grande]
MPHPPTSPPSSPPTTTGTPPSSIPSHPQTLLPDPLHLPSRRRRLLHQPHSPPQAKALRRAPGVLSVVPDRIRHLHTTRTPHFLGLTESTGLWPNSDYADNTIIGVLDTGNWPKRRSFSDSGLHPVPGAWIGTCLNYSSSSHPNSHKNRRNDIAILQ